jgi:hypothetical protein
MARGSARGGAGSSVPGTAGGRRPRRDPDTCPGGRVRGGDEATDYPGDPAPLSAPAADETWLAGRYRLEERLSEQDGSSVWKATDESLARTVTLQIFTPEYRDVAAVVTAARAAARMSDPRLVQTFDADDRAEHGYIVTEWPSGERLDDVISTGPLEPRRAAEIIAEAARGVAAAHAAGLVHLCLTPDSVWWNRWGEVKISGVATAAALSGAEADNPAQEDTRGLARLLYAALTGYWPGPEHTRLPPAPQSDGRPQNPAQVRSGISRDIDAVTRRAMFGEADSYGPPILSPTGLAVALSAIAHPSADTQPLSSMAPRTQPFAPVPALTQPFTAVQAGAKPGGPARSQPAAPGPARAQPTAPAPQPTRAQSAAPAPEPARAQPTAAPAPEPARAQPTAAPAPEPARAQPTVPAPEPTVVLERTVLQEPAAVRQPTRAPAETQPASPEPALAPEPTRVQPAAPPSSAAPIPVPAPPLPSATAALPGRSGKRDRIALAGSAWRTIKWPQLPTVPAPVARALRVPVVVLAIVVCAMVGWLLGHATSPAHSSRSVTTTVPAGAAVHARTLKPVSASSFDPYGTGQSDQLAPLAIDGNPATAWHTDWYTTAEFGNLKPGTGLLIDMGHSMTITEARIALGSIAGADFQLRVGASAASLGDMHTVARATGAGGHVDLRLSKPAYGRYVLIWFTKLPPDASGTFQVSVYNVTLKGSA